MIKARSTSRNQKKSRRYYYKSSNFEVSIILLELIDSEIEKKKKKMSKKKPDKKNKKKGYTYTTVSNSNLNDYNIYLIKVYKAISDKPNIKNKNIHEYIVIVKN